MSGAAAVQAAQAVPLSKAPEAMDVSAGSEAAEGEDLYTRLKTLQRQLEFVEIQVCFGRSPPARRLPSPPAAPLCPCAAPGE